ncbi:4Fe-4S dicluster domain-containing protein [Infirmifilum lucidum]|uniref:4Fe-4S dicluster domain-containing protein n=1 Tax=Infirmifilum lucidum TaxID=2776706 RepID=A0A7L9FGJ3_9CREN|nr:4Fe-4S dicluster domain-containing protein [Infirmifilum lucidum]QOJ78920.1 4Fe-4S dicluster domain-containing protein [Infirmifilum lucidum]
MVRLVLPSKNEGYGVVVDIDKCIGCRACEIACQAWNGRKAVETTFSGVFANPPDLTADTWKVVFYYESEAQVTLSIPEGSFSFQQVQWTPLPFQCMHCYDSPCARACPVGAIKVTPEGAVVIRAEECVGCGYCQTACPYSVPRRGSDGKFYKCTFCVDRIQNGLRPACVEACPTGVFTFTTIQKAVEMAREAQSQGKVVYGLDLNSYIGGGTRWIYVASEKKASAAFKEKLPENPVVAIRQTQELLKNIAIPGFSAGAVALAIIGGFAFWRAKRVEQVAREGGEE